MEWTQIALYCSVVFLAIVLACWLINLVLVLRKKDSNLLLSRIMYLAGMAAVAINAVRSAVVYSEKTMMAASVIALACLAVSFVRMERHEKYGDPEEEEDEE